MEPGNRFQGMNSASLCSLAGRYDNPIPPRFLAPIDCLKIPALLQIVRRCGGTLPLKRRHGYIRVLALLPSLIWGMRYDRVQMLPGAEVDNSSQLNNNKCVPPAFSLHLGWVRQRSGPVRGETLDSGLFGYLRPTSALTWGWVNSLCWLTRSCGLGRSPEAASSARPRPLFDSRSRGTICICKHR